MRARVGRCAGGCIQQPRGDEGVNHAVHNRKHEYIRCVGIRLPRCTCVRGMQCRQPTLKSPANTNLLNVLRKASIRTVIGFETSLSSLTYFAQEAPHHPGTFASCSQSSQCSAVTLPARRMLTYSKEPSSSPTVTIPGTTSAGTMISSKVPFSIEDILFQNNNNNNSNANFNVKSVSTGSERRIQGSQHVIDSGGGSNSSSASSESGSVRKVPQFVHNSGNNTNNIHSNSSDSGRKLSDTNVINSGSNSVHNNGHSGISSSEEDYRKALQAERWVKVWNNEMKIIKPKLGMM